MKRNYILLFIALVITLGIFSYVFLSGQKSSTKNDNTLLTTDDSNINTAENVPVDPLVNANLSQAERQQIEVRDSKRLSDMRKLQAALEKYKADNSGAYPTQLIDLVPKYISGLPGNPAPGGITYTYTPIGTSPYTFYDLSYVLELGAEGVGPGQHSATPEGVAAP